jgi:tight adherence protein B
MIWFCLICSGVAVALFLAARAFIGVDADTPARPTKHRFRSVVAVAHDRLVLRLALAALSAVAVGALTAMPVAVAAAGVFGFFAPNLSRARRQALARQDKLAAIADWTGQIRSLMEGSSNLGEAIRKSQGFAPAVITGDVTALATALEGGMSPRTALRRFGAALDDPAADFVVASLIIGFESGSRTMSEMLSRMAATTRKEVDMRLRIDAGRSARRTTIRGIVGFTVLFTVALFVLQPMYLEQYRTAAGQLVLAVVFGLYTVAFFMLARLARPDTPERFMRSGALGDPDGGPTLDLDTELEMGGRW